MKPKPSEPQSRILIVDDHPAVREALASRITSQSDLTVCGEADNISDALRLVSEVQPDLVVVDISLKSGDGIDLIKRIKAHNDRIRMLVWSMHSESLYAIRALAAGAMGYVNKDQATDLMVDAIRRVLEGKVYLSAKMSEKLLHRAVGSTRDVISAPPLESLADRELEVFRMIGQGIKTSDIADRLHLSIKTIETYRDRIRQKLNLSDGTELAFFATTYFLENK